MFEPADEPSVTSPTLRHGLQSRRSPLSSRGNEEDYVLPSLAYLEKTYYEYICKSHIYGG
jgi:hypothetical protein